MENLPGWIESFADKHTWIWASLAVLAAFQTFMKGIRDAIDSTPDTDDNWFEKFVSVITKVSLYTFLGQRAKK